MIDDPLGTAVWYYYHYDGLGSVIALSNISGTVVEKYSYDAFGKTTVIQDGGTGNPYRFTGRRWDAETGLYYYRARMYSPELGRFLQTDPIGYDDGMNMYAYVGNDPTNLVDPLGLCKERRKEQLLKYIANAEQAMIDNINTLNLLHQEIEDLHDYYYAVLVLDTAYTAISVPITVHKFFVAKSLGKAAKLSTKAPFPDAVNTSVKLSIKSEKTLRAAKVAAGLDAARTAVSVLSIFKIEYARNKSIEKYDVLVVEVANNIESLSKGVSAAYEELGSLGYE